MGQLWSKVKLLLRVHSIHFCIVGPENSGKTTLLELLAHGEAVINTVPTIGVNVKQAKLHRVTMHMWDMSGHERFRSEWPIFAQGCDCIIFVLDASDRERIRDARHALHALLDNRVMRQQPLLIAMNKVDVSPHLSVEECIDELNLLYVTENPWVVLPISALNSTNIEPLVEWLCTRAKANADKHTSKRCQPEPIIDIETYFG